MRGTHRLASELACTAAHESESAHRSGNQLQELTYLGSMSNRDRAVRCSKSNMDWEGATAKEAPLPLCLLLRPDIILGGCSQVHGQHGRRLQTGPHGRRLQGEPHGRRLQGADQTLPAQVGL